MNIGPKSFVLIFLLSAFISGCGSLINNQKFDSPKWKSGDKRSRGQMVYDLHNSKVVIGKNKLEVAEILGAGEDFQNYTVFYIDTGITWDDQFKVHYDESGNRVVSTDIGD
ncbi:hypothetical protein BH10ACI2_BH10ACI2_01230 [soil metagenome]